MILSYISETSEIIFFSRGGIYGNPKELPIKENAAAEPVEEKPRFIENPLPLPKKHVKKEMDYQYPVEDKDMKYDVEVDEKDDFDIQ